jgi:hypothetical protein
MLMQRHPHITTFRLYLYVLGCVLDGFACGEPPLPGVVRAKRSNRLNPEASGSLSWFCSHACVRFV